MPDPRPARELVIDTVELRRRTGAQRPVVTTAVLDGLFAGDFSVVDYTLDVDLVLEAVTEGIVAAGSASGEWTGPCRRCLDPIVASLRIDIHEVFERNPSEGDTWPIEDDRIDLEPVLRECAVLALPLVPLCRDDCVGPEPARFPTVVESDIDLTDEDLPTGAPAPDPRWAALDELRFDE